MAATALEDRALVLEVYERVKQMRRKLSKLSNDNLSPFPPTGPSGCPGLITHIPSHGEPPSQLSAAHVGHPSPHVALAQSEKCRLPNSSVV